MKKIIIIFSIFILGCANQNKKVEPSTEVECSLPDSTDHSDDGHDDSDEIPD